MSPPKLAQRTSFLRQSEIRRMTLECERLGGVNLSQGVCDTAVPEAVMRATREALSQSTNTYTRYDGVSALRTQIAHKWRTYNGLDYDPDTEIVVTPGSTGAFYGACLALLDPGDEAVLFEPYYGYHVDTLRAVEAQPRFVTLEPPLWEFDRRALERCVTSRTRMIVVNTPTNPSGKVFSRHELEQIRDVACERNLTVVTDEIYEHFLYDGAEHLSPATIDGLRERTITISGFSKTLSVTGWRLGYSGSPPPIAARLGTINDLVYICAPSVLQAGVAAALPLLDAGFYAALAEEYLEKRNRICAALTDSGLPPVVPRGAYYVLADVTRIAGATPEQRVMELLHRTGVASVPGSSFYDGSAGSRLARLCFAKTQEDLEKACAGLRRLE